MADYIVELERVAFNGLAKAPRSDQERLKAKLKQLEQNPRPSGAIKLTGTEAWRVRSGDYRIVYVIDDALLIVTMTRVAHRKSVYRR